MYSETDMEKERLPLERPLHIDHLQPIVYSKSIAFAVDKTSTGASKMKKDLSIIVCNMFLSS